MATPALIALAIAAVPAAWLALVLVDRIPDASSLVRPAPAFPLPRGRRGLDLAAYPVMVALFVLVGTRFEEALPVVAHAALCLVLVALSVIDIETLRLPDRLTFPTAAAAALVIAGSAWVGDEWVQLTGAAVGAVTYFGVLLVAHLVHPRGMGFGDVKLAFVMGLFLGWPSGGGLASVVVVVWAMLIGFGLGSVLGMGILVVRGRSAPYPFGPFLVAGTVAVILSAPTLLPSSVELLF